MEGITKSIQGLCLQEDMLITDDTNHYCCVSDFDINPDTEVDYELDSDEDFDPLKQNYLGWH